MKLLSQTSLLLMALMVVFAGCDQAKDMAKKGADMANIDFGDFDIDGMKEKLTGVTDGLKDVTTENVDGVTSKITDLSDSVDGMGIDKLPAPAKTFVSGMLTKFGDSVKAAMEGISDDSILAKLKPAVEALMEKVKAYK